MNKVNIKKLITGLLITLGLVTLAVLPANAQTESTAPAEISLPTESVEIPQDEYFKAEVVGVEDQPASNAGGIAQPVQKVKLKISSGAESGREIEVEHGGLFAISEEQKVKTGESVVIVKTQGPQGELYYITDRYRTEGVALLFGIFFLLAVIFGKARGASAIIGLIFSILVLIKFVIPEIIAGRDPLVTSLIGALIIAVISLYMAHGITKRTTVALASTILTLLISGILAIVFVKIAGLSGTGSEEAVFLRMGPIGNIDLKGLLLGGIIIGALGVLDDITTTQSAAVDELRRANPTLSKRELFTRGLSIGREHIASLINTLALAYAGASFPLLLLFSLGGNIPFWLTFNSEFIVEEIVRTLVGSSALILAVPISTFLAANFLVKPSNIGEVELAVEPVKAARRRSTAKKTTRTKRKTSR